MYNLLKYNLIINVIMENLVISVGGSAIVCLAGAIDYLYNNQNLNNIKNYYGISAGSILCSMLALNMPINDIKTFVLKTNPEKIVENPDIDNLLINYGLLSNKNFIIVIQTIIKHKTTKVNYTFKNLYDNNKKILNIFATDIDNRELIKFNYLTTPDVPIWKAIIASCSIPIMFEPFIINNKRYIDGGVLNSYPAHFIPVNEHHKTIGILYSGRFNYEYDDNDIIKYFLNIILCRLNFDTNNFLPFESFTIKIPKKDINPLNFNLSIDERQSLYEHGIKSCAEQYIKLFKPNIKRRNSF